MDPTEDCWIKFSLWYPVTREQLCGWCILTLGPCPRGYKFGKATESKQAKGRKEDKAMPEVSKTNGMGKGRSAYGLVLPGLWACGMKLLTGGTDPEALLWMC